MAAELLRPQSSWAEHRLRARIFWTVLMLGPVIAIWLAIAHLLPRFGAHGLIWPLVLWALAVLAAGLYWQRFLCPRCGKTYYRQSPPLLALRADRCRSCMLPEDH